MNAEEIISKGLIKSAVISVHGLASVKILSEVYHQQINNLSRQIKLIKEDEYRNDIEKAGMYKKVSSYMTESLGSTLVSIIDTIELESIHSKDLKESTLKGGEKSVNLVLATHLRENRRDVINLLESDMRYAQAATEFPASYFGLEDETLKVAQERSLLRNIPELAKQERLIENSKYHSRRLVRYFNGLSAELEMLANDHVMKSSVNKLSS
ncbi:MAG: hypothetical protein ACI9MS_001300 [Glaciecola sp.]|mgnify:CR=1 FL=1|jgi:hypothetical protein